MSILLLHLSILPVVLLLLYIYFQDKYEKEPFGLLLLAFFGGMIAIPMDLLLVSFFNALLHADSIFFSAFFEAGFCEELCKFIILFLFFWWSKNFNEHMDGIVYAVFVGLGFACVENILYVFQGGIGTGIVRAILSVPGHFLFAVVMGYFLSLAKFGKERRFTYLLLSLFCAAFVHGLFDWILMTIQDIPTVIALILFGLFVFGDIMLWRVCIKFIRRHQENSPFKE